MAWLAELAISITPIITIIFDRFIHSKSSYTEEKKNIGYRRSQASGSQNAFLMEAT